ncbi:MAG TPA: hypothetical protein VM143_10475 [Acidimicrobiales bacterium]|nr:hypothetical protein [Acidimicrobiales bacterium]
MFEATPASVAEARRFVTSTLGGCQATTVDDAAPLTSELATNADLRRDGPPAATRARDRRRHSWSSARKPTVWA